MTTANLYTPAQVSNSEPLHAEGLTTQAGFNPTHTKTVLMRWAEWARTPKDYRLTSLYGQQGRWVMRASHQGQGVTLFPVHITG
ncbi:MAG: hypothetical protein ACYCSN_13945 [Acidobacteriaceae bacterium]